METQKQLGDFLRRRREALVPANVGPVDGRRRRTPGLRRQEVADLACVSEVYYERLEQGRGRRPSPSVLAGLTEALRLSADERDHLYRLAGHAAPATAGTRTVDPGLEYILREVEATTPAFVTDELGEVLAQNRLNIALFGDFSGLVGLERNVVWRYFTSAMWRDNLDLPENQEGTAQAYVADLRSAVLRRGDDPASRTLVSRLLESSPMFTRMWQEYPVSVLSCPDKVVHHPRVGRLELECNILSSLSGTGSPQRLLLLKAVPGSLTAQRLLDLSEEP